MAEGLRGRFAEEYPAWNAGLAELFRQLADVRLKILLFGPGRRPDTIDKRQEIARRLVAQDPLNEPLTSEEPIEAHPEFDGMHPYDAELLHVLAADVVLVVITERATGSQAEVATFWHNQAFRDRAYLITPKLTRRERQKRIRQSPYLSQGWLAYPLERQFQYTPEEYADCAKIRDHCNEVVKRVRWQIGLARLRRA